MRKLSKILVFVLAFAMMFTLASMFTASAAGETKTIYFKPTGSWIQNNEKYAVWSWGGNTGSTWHDLSDVDGDGVYSTDIPYADTTVIFVRMEAGKPTDWSSKWDQTVNISLGSTNLSATYYSNTSSKEGDNFKYSTTAYTPAHICTPEVVEEVPSTCIKPGYQVKVCSDPTCGAEQKVDLPAGHTLVGGTCSVCGFNTAEEHTVYFKNTDNWATVKAYYWGTNNPVAWPGAAITEENGLYAITLPAGSYNIIFNNQVNDAGPKSVDLVVPAEPMVYNWETKAWEELPHVHNYVNDMLCECGKAKFPTAKVTPILNEKLSFALNFTFDGLENWTEEYIAALLEQYGNWLVDFRLTISGLEAESVRFNADDETADGYLGGEYGNYGWWYVPFSDAVVENNGSLLIMSYAAGSTGEAGLRYTLAEVAQVVVDFDCGMYFTPAFFEANPNVQVKLELVVVPVEDGVQGEEESLTTNVFGKDDAHVHEYGEGSVTLAPTCLTNGTYTQTCACGKVVETEIPASADYHYYVLDICFYCYDVKPSIVLGNNTVVVPESGSAFGMIYIEEAGKYNITATGALTSCIFKDSIFATGSDFSIALDGTLGASWYNFAQTPEFVELEAGYYYVGVYGAGEYTVTVNKYIDPATCEHVYFYTNCTLCGTLNPYFAYNFMVVGTNNVVCNQYHLVDTAGHGNPYQFTTFTVTEAGHYKFTSDKLVGLTLFTTEINSEGADFTAGTGASWAQYITGNEIDLEPGTYYIGIIFVDGVGEYEITLEKVEPTEEPEQPTEEPEELGFFAQIWAKIVAFFASIVEFFKGIFVKG